MTIGFDSVFYNVNELSSFVTLRVIVFGNVTNSFTAVFFVTSGSAVSPNDFVNPGERVIRFNDDSTEININIGIVSDFVIEDTEHFFGHLRSKNMAVLYENNMTTINITDGDCKTEILQMFVVLRFLLL